MNSMAEELTFTVPLSFEAHAIADQLRQQQSNPRKGKQVYLNTLAVYAVDFYLRCMGLKTDWAGSDSRNPERVRSLDIADLQVNLVGKVECRPVLPEAAVCTLPPEVQSDRIGYVVVRLDQALKQATLLGVTQAVAPELSLSQLHPLAKLLAYCTPQKESEVVRLSDWFTGAIAANWLPLESLLGRELAVGFRSSALNITRGQQIDLGLQLAEQPVALVVTLPPEATDEIDIRVQVYPMVNYLHLPPGLKLSVMDETEQVRLDTIARETDHLIQLEFSAALGEQFRIQVALGESSITQLFVL
jgi:Protein of unknown function (DUF1822)